VRADADIVILGAGCAGLSLAASLGAEKVPGSVLLLEPRSSYTRDRTWCFWNTEEHLFTSAISHRWESWRVSRGPQAVVQQSRRYQYCHIAGDDFYAEGLRAVERDPRQELCCGVSVDSVEPRAGGLVRVETSSGGIVARRVFDSRPAAPSVAPLLVQRFVGWHVRAARACFEERTVELMRFLPSDQPGRVRFLYLLPFSPTEALVEMTYLDAPELPEPFAENELKEWLEDNVGEWEVLYKEQGALPMAPAGKPAAYSPMKASLALDHSLEHVHSIGARGGRLKPSSGYGFVRIQRHSRVIARALAQGRPVPLTAEPQRYSLMDAVFLRALQTADAAELFLAMFANADPDALVRFLGEASPVSETLRVAWSLPKLPMLGAAIRNWRAA
jgi:lycopene beta-cyclase